MNQTEVVSKSDLWLDVWSAHLGHCRKCKDAEAGKRSLRGLTRCSSGKEYIRKIRLARAEEKAGEE